MKDRAWRSGVLCCSFLMFIPMVEFSAKPVRDRAANLGVPPAPVFTVAPPQELDVSSTSAYRILDAHGIPARDIWGPRRRLTETVFSASRHR